jgi:hypothetical protein
MGWRGGDWRNNVWPGSHGVAWVIESGRGKARLIEAGMAGEAQ